MVPAQTAWAKSAPPLPTLPLQSFVVERTSTTKDGPRARPVVDGAFIDEQIRQTNSIFGEFGIRFAETAARRPLEEKWARLESRVDRDGLAESMVAEQINVFFVEALRDVDDPKLFRMGVTWRKLTNLKKKYVIVAASARPTTLAHELGHYLGNDHTYVKNNLMSYERDGGKVTLSQAQADKSRRTALALFASKALRPAAATTS